MIGPVSRRLALRTGLSCHFLEWGNAEPALAQPRHTVVLLHGFLDFAWTWEEVVQSGLFGRYHLIAPDLRGHGDSDRVGPGGYYHFMDYLADVHDLIAQIKRERQERLGGEIQISLVGHSMGGSVAFYYAGAYPEQIFRLALIEGLGPPAEERPFDGAPERIRTWLAAWRRVASQEPRLLSDLEEAAARLRQRDPRLGAGLALRLAEHGTLLLPDGKRAFKHDPLHLTPGPYPFILEIAEAFWRRISCPVLLVGAADSEFKLSDEELARRASCFSNLRSVMLTGAGHMIQRHQPEALSRHLADFLG